MLVSPVFTPLQLAPMSADLKDAAAKPAPAKMVLSVAKPGERAREETYVPGSMSVLRRAAAPRRRCFSLVGGEVR